MFEQIIIPGRQVETEQQLLNDILSGNRIAMRKLYDRYAGYTMATAMRYIPDRDKAADVVQDAFVKILTTLNSFSYRGEGSLRAWVTRVTANQALDALKQDTRLHQLLTTEADLPPQQLQNLPDEEPDVSHISPDVLTRLIAKLPPGYRAVLNLHIFEGRSHKEIAALLGIKPDSSASQFLRAKRMLAKMINESINHND